MRGSKAKAIRRKVYGDQSLRQPRQYDETNHRRKLVESDWLYTGARIVNTHTLVNAPSSLRAKYQAEKKVA
jgi:hypothetical protein